MTQRALLTSILDVAKLVVPVIGGPAGGTFLAAGQAAITLIDSVRGKGLFSSAEEEQLEVTRAELDQTVARVNAHADQTLDRLKG